MDRIKGYYWIKISYYSGWHVAYWDGIGWKFSGRDLSGKFINDITETPIPEPGEKEVKP